MRKFRLIIAAVALMVSSTASAQFSNVNMRGNRSSNGSSLSEYGAKAGYKGFAEFGYTFGVGDGTDRLSLYNTHGYQIDKNFFIGAGVGVNYFTKGELFNMPIFADFRVNILDFGITPFVGVKAGYSLFDVSGFFFSPTVGCRFAPNDKIAYTFTFGYELQRFSITTEYRYDDGYYDSNFNWQSRWITEKNTNSGNAGGLVMKVGIEF